MKRTGFVAAVCGALLFSSAATAAEPTSAPAASAQPSPRALELTRRYFAAMDMDKMLRTMSDSMIGALASGEQMRQLPPEVRQAMVESVTEASAASYAGMKERYVVMIASQFTEAELQALVDFYESPLGRSIVAKTGQLAAQAGQLTQEMMPAMMKDTESRFCAKVELKPGCFGMSGER